MKPEEQDRSSGLRAAPLIWRGFVPPRTRGGLGAGALRHRAGELAEEAGKPPAPADYIFRWAAPKLQPGRVARQ